MLLVGIMDAITLTMVLQNERIMSSKIRIVHGQHTGQIYATPVTECNGLSWSAGKTQDVTADVIQAVSNMIGIGNSMEFVAPGRDRFLRITIEAFTE